jgi:hypothetical protein
LANLAAFNFDPTSSMQMQLVCPARNFFGGLFGRALKLGVDVGPSCQGCPLKRKLPFRKKPKKALPLVIKMPIRNGVRTYWTRT